jgi:hypothetical protein
MSNLSSYESKAKISTIRATSRASVKIRDNYYTLEYTEERVIPDIEGVDITAEKKILWDAVNEEVDAQIEDVIKSFK